MLTYADVTRIALALPGTTEENGKLRAGKGMIAWLREQRRNDPDDPLTGQPWRDVLGVRVADEGVKRALIADNPRMYFTIPHFDGYPAVLVRLDEADPAELAELLEEAWLLRVSRRAGQAYLAAKDAGTG